MANLTIAIDDDLLRRARRRALEQGRSINALLRDFLESYTGRQNAYEIALHGLDRLADNASSGSGGRTWTRDELYERGAI